ncbi:MAG: glutamate racemase [Clostridia bacterium]|nr:glutamate racemase [Clostridia bacterium]
MNNPSSPIGVFDSGMGGISVLQQLLRVLPHEDMLYFGDGANAPYGTKPTAVIRDLTERAAEHLLARGAKAIVLACNTATSAAAAALRERYPDLPVIGLEPALKPAALSAAYPTVVVMATPLTLKEEKFAALTRRFADKCRIIALPAPGLVPLVEAGRMGTDDARTYIEALFAPYRDEGIDCVVLGCTHFPFMKRDLRAVLGHTVRFYDGAEGAARQTRVLLDRAGLLNPKETPGTICFENSDETRLPLMERLLQYEID